MPGLFQLLAQLQAVTTCFITFCFTYNSVSLLVLHVHHFKETCSRKVNNKVESEKAWTDEFLSVEHVTPQ